MMAASASRDLRPRVERMASRTAGSSPRAVSCATISDSGSLSSLSTITTTGLNLSGVTPSGSSTFWSTLRELTRMPTSAAVSPISLKNVTIVARSSASALTHGSPRMSQFHW
eukprot:Amastigsp_a362695_12.p6 type:complete len:112 gc:universal Amastigsp_a362695_12:631-966(+)